MEAIRQLDALWVYASLCARAPADLPECDSFWTGASVVTVGAVALAALYILRQMTRNFLVVRAERQRLGERSRVADPDTMSKYRVDSEKFYSDPSQEGIEQRIRQTLDERKLRDQSLRPGVAREKENPE
jgi:hypothetical protein